MINRTKLLSDLKVQVKDLETDLRARFASDIVNRPGFRGGLLA